MNFVLSVWLLLHGSACAWTTEKGDERRTYVMGFGIVSQPVHEGQDPSKVWVQEVKGLGLGMTQGAGPSHIFCGAFNSHEIALPTGWEGAVEYKKSPLPATQPAQPPPSKIP